MWVFSRLCKAQLTTCSYYDGALTRFGASGFVSTVGKRYAVSLIRGIGTASALARCMRYFS